MVYVNLWYSPFSQIVRTSDKKTERMSDSLKNTFSHLFLVTANQNTVSILTLRLCFSASFITYWVNYIDAISMQTLQMHFCLFSENRTFDNSKETNWLSWKCIHWIKNSRYILFINLRLSRLQEMEFNN